MNTCRVKLNISAGGEPNKPAVKRMSLKEAEKILRSKRYSPDVEKSLLKDLHRRPEGSYVAFLTELPRRARETTKKLGESLC